MPDHNGAVDLGDLSQEEQEALDKMAEADPGPPEVPSALTGFAVVLGTDGNPQVSQLPDNLPVSFLTEPTPDLVYAACQTICKDISSQETASTVAQIMTQQAMRMQDEMQQQAIQQRLHQSGLRRG